MEIYILDP